jgi:hypothetical protein
MTPQQMQDAITDLMEVRREISTVNRNAGRTVFNPAATEALDALIAAMREAVAQ